MRPRATWRRRSSVPTTPAPKPRSSDWDPFIGGIIGMGLMFFAVNITVNLGLQYLERLPKAEHEVAWADRVDESDTSWPAVVDDDGLVVVYRATTTSPEPEPEPPKGRCLNDGDCRSTGICLQVGGVGVCATCRMASDCTGDDVCNENGDCVRCVSSSSCPGVELCVDNRCVLPAPTVGPVYSSGDGHLAPPSSWRWRGMHVQP